MPYQNPNAPLLEGFGNLGAALMLAPRMAAKNKQSELDRADRAKREDDALARSLRGELAATERHNADMKNANEQRGFDRQLQRELYGQKAEAATAKAANSVIPASLLGDVRKNEGGRFPAAMIERGYHPLNMHPISADNPYQIPIPAAEQADDAAFLREHASSSLPAGVTPDDPHGMPSERMPAGITPDDPHGDPSTIGLPALSPPEDDMNERDLLGNAIHGNPQGDEPAPVAAPIAKTPPVASKPVYPQPTAGAPRLEPVSKKGRDAARMEAANPNTPAPDPAYVKTLVGLSTTDPTKLKSLLIELKNRNLSEYQAVAKALREHANAE
jgi:hypothetical protein